MANEKNTKGCVSGDAEPKENPFYSAYGTPFSTVPFDRIEVSDYLPALREGMRRQREEIAEIVNNPDAPTFENTIVALERSGSLLSRVQYPFYNLLSADSNDELEKAAQEIAPEESDHGTSILLNEKLFARVKAVWVQRESLALDVEDRKLLEDTYDSFVNHGANLQGEDRETYKRLVSELSVLTLNFGQNSLKSSNSYTLNVTDKGRLGGLPDYVMQAAEEKAKQKNQEGWTFDLSYPSYFPFMKFAEDRALREQLYRAYNTKSLGGEYDNRENVKKIVNTRLAIARLLGKRTYAESVLRRRMASEPSRVYGLLDQLLEAYRPKAEQEVREVSEYARSVGFTDTLQAWDWAYYSNLLKESRYSISDSIVKPYFELSKVKEGVFGLATTLYGLRFVPNKQIPVYHPDVEAFEVYDGDGRFMAVLYTDFHPREGKQSGAWMTEMKQQWKENGEDSRPHISLVMNFSKPTGGKPALLTYEELTTFLHEFGHSIHGMLADGKYASLTGTNVYRDFVEMPSQLMENWAGEKAFLDRFAVHYETGEQMPAELVSKIKASENFNTGYACLRQLSFGYLDMAWHDREEEFEGDVEQFEKEAWARTRLLPAVDGTCMSVQFGHIFSGGYAAGYYGYKWAEVLDADVFSKFQENGLFDKATATRLRREILSKGGSEHPMVLYKRFMGREPKIDALLRRNGIK
ncbi:MAG: M3 family metallopeptidase [Paludibacteraceae bacterium]|nr:M3 family metallopeptidase [Paludibacteraceae bacterium]